MGLNLNDLNQKVLQLDVLLGNLAKVFKKHWWVLLTCAAAWFLYDAETNPEYASDATDTIVTTDTIVEEIIIDVDSVNDTSTYFYEYEK